MDDFTTDAPIDAIDRACMVEEMQRECAIASHRGRLRFTDPPDEDDEGNRYCLDCGDIIPPARIAAVPTAVRCIKCASQREARDNLAKQRGGVLAAYPDAAEPAEPVDKRTKQDVD